MFKHTKTNFISPLKITCIDSIVTVIKSCHMNIDKTYCEKTIIGNQS